jgi:hypothetical protein
MSPEQLRGRVADARSDVFSFCVALYEALYGVRPFAGSNLLELQARIDAGVVSTTSTRTRVPGWILATLLRGLRAAPEDRFPTMPALLDALQTAQARSRRRAWAVLGVTMAAVVVSVIYLAEGPGTLRHGAPVAAPSPATGAGATALPPAEVTSVASAESSEGVERIALSARQLASSPPTSDVPPLPPRPTAWPSTRARPRDIPRTAPSGAQAVVSSPASSAAPTGTPLRFGSNGAPILP